MTFYSIANVLGVHSMTIGRLAHVSRRAPTPEFARECAIALEFANWGGVNNVRRRCRLARAILKLSKGLTGTVYAVWCDPDVYVTTDPAELIAILKWTSTGARVIDVTAALRKLESRARGAAA